MTEHDCNSADAAVPDKNQQRQLTKLYDELQDVIAMQVFLYDAMEAITQDAGNSMSDPISHDGLMLWHRQLKRKQHILLYRLQRINI